MGTLYVVATPIGNLEDITVRAKRILLSVPVIVCEDTRHTGNLIKILERETEVRRERKYLSVRDWNEAEMVARVLGELGDNDVALVSDAGTPLISDPGFKIVRGARAAGINVFSVPGANAAVTALAVSGLPTNKFVFLGFLGKRWELYGGMTNIVYESPIRAQKTITEILNRYPDAKVIVAQELTKIHETIEEYKEGMKFKGEVTILIWLPEQVSADHGDGNGDVHDR